MKKLLWVLILAATIILNPFHISSAIAPQNTYHDEWKAVQWITDEDGTMYEIGWSKFY